MKVFLGFASLFVSLQFSPVVHASDFAAGPDLTCLDKNNKPYATFNNAQVAQWKTTLPHQALNRGYINGVIDDIFPNKTGHTHFSLKIDNNKADDIEVIYNDEFGALPHLAVGMALSACGDFINTGYSGGGGSPDGAILHWVHWNPKTRPSDVAHANGYIVISGKAYGFDTPAN